MLVNTPSAINHMVPRLTEFVELMAGKLMVNVHKDKLLAKDVPILLDRLAGEVSEFKDEIEAAGDGEIDLNALEELADMGNFCFLLYQHLRDRGLKNVTERFIDEYYDVRPDLGRVYCRKSRSGSSLKPGDEVRGSIRRGQVFIRAQHAISGAAISLARCDLIWWKAKGEWPIGKIDRYKSKDAFPFPENLKGKETLPTVDNIENLYIRVDLSKRDGRLPFVSQYKPRGREQSPNYGKWVYQRRHAFRLVRCGYYDTAEEAATLGLKDWKEKTRRAS